MTSEQLLPIAVRSIQATISNIINMVAVLYIDVVIIALTTNTVPLFAYVLAIFLLGEKLKFDETFFIAINYVAVIVIMVGIDRKLGGHPFSDAPLMYTALFLNPLMQALG